MGVHSFDGFDERRFDMEHAVRTLREADSIRADPEMMSKVEAFIKEEQVDLEKVEQSLLSRHSESVHNV